MNKVACQNNYDRTNLSSINYSKPSYECLFSDIGQYLLFVTARLLRKVKSFKLPSQTELCITIFNSQIRSILDYAFIPIISPTSKIANKLQTIQTRALKTIKYFPLKTSCSSSLDMFGCSVSIYLKHFLYCRIPFLCGRFFVFFPFTLWGNIIISCAVLSWCFLSWHSL